MSYCTYFFAKKKAAHPTLDALFDIRSRGYNPLQLLLLVLPVLLRLADVSLVAELSHLLGLGEELLGLVRISLLN